jgi:hypothetical protein
MANKNEHLIDGILFSKHSQSGTRKKDGKPYEIWFYKLEVPTYLYGKTFNTILEFKLSNDLAPDNFMDEDAITIRFVQIGTQVTEKWFKQENIAIFVQFTDLDLFEKQRVERSNEIKARDIKNPPEVEFPVPVIGGDDEGDDLPF